MSTSAISSVFNDGVIAEQFERYRLDPASVDETWRQYFRIAESLFARFRSRMENTFGDRMLAMMRNQFGGHAVVKK